jgi:hypothetical protein
VIQGSVHKVQGPLFPWLAQLLCREFCLDYGDEARCTGELTILHGAADLSKATETVGYFEIGLLKIT